ncbi:DNA starvation/stationary phase protection protein [Paenibacillus sediminis]|uniref:Starvation-inducible DNA-binding protein n=1 Tax=Paenibacillus sediminis TaxID=664909 RepID=A0ABS4H493_9BACL|nr:DNA starvation/stationary phase protection protein [Paenibacillus sediminis]MBP1937354.1 starvation-inducible DNA-binding protein [Paenibacillus sediminis]
MNQTLEKMMNQHIANWTVLDMKLHNYHWFVKGADFFTLHSKFEELYSEASEIIDEVAERLLAIGGKPIATLKEVMQYTTLQEAEGQATAEQMVGAIVKDFDQLKGEIKEAIKVSDDDNDVVTSDMFTEILGKLDKHTWMLNALLGK